MNFRKCTACDEFKTSDQFRSSFSKKFQKIRFQSNCKICQRKSERRKYKELIKTEDFMKIRNSQAYKIKKRKIQARHRKTIKRKLWMANYLKSEKCRQDYKRYRNKNKNKYNARRAAQRAVESGRIIKPSLCQRCNNFKKLEAHHYLGYIGENRFDVKWLCKSCHMAAHYDPQNLMID